MALKINDDCISCGACQAECPVGAIFEGGEKWIKKDGQQGEPLSEDHYYIMPDICVECSGFSDEPQCHDVCPVEAPNRE